MVIWKQLRQIHLLIPEELLAEIDAAANKKYMSRSSYIRDVLEKEVSGKYPADLRDATVEDPHRFLDSNDS